MAEAASPMHGSPRITGHIRSWEEIRKILSRVSEFYDN
jgi:hypothetical protein